MQCHSPRSQDGGGLGQTPPCETERSHTLPGSRHDEGVVMKRRSRPEITQDKEKESEETGQELGRVTYHEVIWIGGHNFSQDPLRPDPISLRRCHKHTYSQDPCTLTRYFPHAPRNLGSGIHSPDTRDPTRLRFGDVFGDATADANGVAAPAINLDTRLNSVSAWSRNSAWRSSHRRTQFGRA